MKDFAQSLLDIKIEMISDITSCITNDGDELYLTEHVIVHQREEGHDLDQNLYSWVVTSIDVDGMCTCHMIDDESYVEEMELYDLTAEELIEVCETIQAGFFRVGPKEDEGD